MGDKLLDYIPNWDTPAGPCNPSEYTGGYTDSVMGDNPPETFNVSLPEQGDLRIKDTNKGSDPYPGKVGANV